MSSTPPDPMAMWREFLGNWEKMANDVGGEMLKRPEAAQAMHGITGFGMQIQSSVHEAMAKVLSAANMPSKADFDALATRLANIEATLARIEAAGSGATPAAPAPRPARTRKPTGGA